MQGIEYYKSLVTDEEVIRALTKESQAREGTLAKPRVRPNLNFLQRTVSNMVSSNKRLTTHKEKVVKEQEKMSSRRPRKTPPVRKKLHINIIQDILTKKVDFVKSSDEQQQTYRPINNSESSEEKAARNKKCRSKHKNQLEVIREILIGRIESLKSSKANCMKEIKLSKTKASTTSTHSEEIITLDSSSDSDSDDKNQPTKSKKGKYVSNDEPSREKSNTPEIIELSDSDSDYEDIKH